MVRQSRQEIDEAIIDSAAALFARHGLKETSLQRIADAVGYSKSGLLRHFPSKEALLSTVIDRCSADVQEIVQNVSAHAPGPDRDRAALTEVAHLALRRPGLVALIISGLLHVSDDCEHTLLQSIVDALLQAFDVDTETDLNRMIRVVGALGALGVARIALHEHLSADSIDTLVHTSYQALGHQAES